MSRGGTDRAGSLGAYGQAEMMRAFATREEVIADSDVRREDIEK
jgi:hypothetical protein